MLKILSLITILSPLLGSMLAGLGGKKIGRSGAHRATISLMVISFIAALIIGKLVLIDGQTFNDKIYTWALSGGYDFHVGFLIDPFTSVMLLIVTFVSLFVHIYSIGYMHDDPGYQRFFSYVSFFTFAMLMLLTANNFLQLFFGWEGVGLASYLLIGFWFRTEAAAGGSFKAFIVNRVGDMGFILGIAAILNYFGSLDYQIVFAHPSELVGQTITLFPGVQCSVLTLICILLFIGAMGKSAQIPLHIWLPESMAGPTPISALIHAATMVTAGIYMVARVSPLYELSQPALSFILIIGATGALFLGLLAFVENDIKRIIAYSTMSQLGYMMAANGASAFPAGIFHLLTHACFKALLFLAAGSVIIAMHHEQDLRRMGNLRKYMPITYITFLIGALALAAIPPFAGFYSKDAIIEAVGLSTIPGSTYAYICLLIGSFVTAYYIFRAFFLAFHTEERMDHHTQSHLKESPWPVTLPLIVLAIPSVILGILLAYPIIYKTPSLLSSGIYVADQYNVLKTLTEEYHNIWFNTIAAVMHLPFWLSLAGIVSAWYTCVKKPVIREQFAKSLRPVRFILTEKYGFDDFNKNILVKGIHGLCNLFYRLVDSLIIDTFMVDGSGKTVARFSAMVKKLQTGYLYHYVFVMIIGLLGLLCWLVLT